MANPFKNKELDDRITEFSGISKDPVAAGNSGSIYLNGTPAAYKFCKYEVLHLRSVICSRMAGLDIKAYKEASGNNSQNALTTLSAPPN